MRRIQFTIDQRKLAQDHSAKVPDKVFEEGEQAVREWLINTGQVDNALDYAENETKIYIYPES